MQQDLTNPERRNVQPLVPVVWFNEYTDLRQVSPHVATNSDIWVIRDKSLSTDEKEDTDVVGMALIEAEYPTEADAMVHRIGVRKTYQQNGIGSTILDKLQSEYGSLELTCRESLPANDFYENTGWERIGVKKGDPEDLIKWKRTAD